MTANTHPLTHWLALHKHSVRERWVTCARVETPLPLEHCLQAFESFLNGLLSLVDEPYEIYEPQYARLFAESGWLEPDTLISLLRKMQLIYGEIMAEDPTLSRGMGQWSQRLELAFERLIHQELDCCLTLRREHERFKGFGIDERHETHRYDYGHEFIHDRTYPWMARD